MIRISYKGNVVVGSSTWYRIAYGIIYLVGEVSASTKKATRSSRIFGVTWATAGAIEVGNPAPTHAQYGSSSCIVVPDINSTNSAAVLVRISPTA